MTRSDGVSLSNTFRRVVVDGITVELAETLDLTDQDAELLVRHALAFDFTDRAVRTVQVRPDHAKPDEPYAVSIVFDRYRKR